MTQLKAIMQTNKGTININLFADKTPLTCASFANLAQRGYYDGLNFHRVINDFMIQGGCPDGTGMGGPGYKFKDECTGDLRHDKAGILSMANAGPGTNGSQFFITHIPTPHLDNAHTVFGEVLSPTDMEIVNAIHQNDPIDNITIEGDTTALFSKTADKLEEWNQHLKN